MRDEDFMRREYKNARAGSDDETQFSTCRAKNRDYVLQLNNDVSDDAEVSLRALAS